MEDILGEKENTNKFMKEEKCRVYQKSYNRKSSLLCVECERTEKDQNLKVNSGQILKIFDTT